MATKATENRAITEVFGFIVWLPWLLIAHNQGHVSCQKPTPFKVLKTFGEGVRAPWPKPPPVVHFSHAAAFQGPGKQIARVLVYAQPIHYHSRVSN
jgi:hypothetical protein